MRIPDAHIFITGAAKRIGRLIAENFSRKGARLTLHARDSGRELAALAEEIRAQGTSVHTVSFDLNDVAAIRNAVDSAERALGPIRILINSASVFFPTPLDSVTESQWDELQDANLKGQFFLAVKCAEAMKAAGGLIINLCDTSAQRTLRHYSPYLASKAGLVALTRNMAKELAPKIRVNAVSPGWVLTPEGCPAEQIARNIEMTLLKRIGEPADVIAAIEFLVENDYVTGQNIVVDGGRAIR